VAVALSLGTMISWKRIVITVGEKVGKTYAQGACAEITAAATIAAAHMYGAGGRLAAAYNCLMARNCAAISRRFAITSAM
jgi:hypothetical protein